MASRDRPVRIESRLPCFDGSGKHSEELDGLTGATILRIGTSPDLKVEGGGLVIEYRSAAGLDRLLVLGCSELGMWIETNPGSR